MPICCVDCGTEEVWTAMQQKWWYEVMKGAIHSRAIRCRACRRKRRAIRRAANQRRLDGIARKKATKLAPSSQGRKRRLRQSRPPNA
ncbi:MAG: zinc-ribbon domain containing protein [Blastopirellula sp. JB062]